MENASKALLMAGGILLAIITLSLIIYLTSSTTRMAEEQDAKTLSEQITEFNKSYEAYNRRRMYGTDVITIVNKAIDHNRRMNAGETNRYYVNIVVNTTESFMTTVDEVDNTKTKNNKRTMSATEAKVILGSEINATLNAGQYQLGDWQRDGVLEMDQGIIDFFSEDKTDGIKSSNDKKYTYYIYSALTNFKRAIFRCDGVEYNPNTGRIQSMTFSQI